MVTFDEALHVRLGSLQNAIDDWTETVKKLESLQEKAENGLKHKAEKADWKGENAGVTLPFVRKTAKEFEDAAKEAKSIRNILRDAHSEFKAAKGKLEAIIETAHSQNINVHPDGTTLSLLVHPDRKSKDNDSSNPGAEDYEKIRSEINAAVQRATEADEVASRALQTLVGKDDNNFSGTEYDSLKQADKVQAAEDAKAAARIVAKGDDATPQEIDRLNRYLKDNKGDSYFSQRFAIDVGPKGTLDYWGDMGDSSDGSRLGIDHPKKIAELQKNWSLTLASASHSDSPDMVKWKADMIKSGDDLIRTRGSSAYGFQIMSNLMREGNYDSKFLHDYGNAAVATERRLTHEGSIKPEQAWNSNSASTPRLNWDGKGVGQDPMTGFMEALGHNPKASADFFNSKLDLTPDNAHDHKDVDAFKYFTKDRDWPQDITNDGRSSKYGYESLGHALESATLGHSYDDPKPHLIRTEDGGKVMGKIVEAYGDPELLKKEEALSGSIGRMTAGYVDDVNWALNENRPDSMFAPGKGEPGHVQFGMDGTRDFLSALGQHPDAYSEVARAERIYTSATMEAQVDSNGHINEPHVREALRTGSEVQGMLDQSRADQVEAEGLKKDKEYNDALAKRGGWIEFAAGVGVATGAAFLPPVAAAGVAGTLIPLGMEHGQALIEKTLGDSLGDWTESSQKDSGDDIQKQRSAIYRAGEINASQPLKEFIGRHGISADDDGFSQDLESDFDTGYGKGTDRENQQGVRPKA